MAAFTARPGVTLTDAALWFEATGGRYDIKAALTAGAGTIITTNEGLAARLRAIVLADGLPALAEQARSWVETWASTHAFGTPAGLAVNASRVWGVGQGQRPFHVGEGGRGRVTAALRLAASGGGNSYEMIGLSKDPPGVPVANGVNLLAAGIDPTIRRPFVYQGSGVGGAGALDYMEAGAGGPALDSPLFYFTTSVDEYWISLTLVNEDHTLEYGRENPVSRDLFGGPVENVAVWQSDNRAAGVGTEWGTIGAIESSQVVRPRSGDVLAAGADSVIYTRPNAPEITVNERIRVNIPAAYDSAVGMAACLYVHGQGENAFSPWTDTTVRAYHQAIADGPYIYASTDGHGNAWGNPVSIQDYLDLWEWLDSHLVINDVLLLAMSMGGVAAASLLASEQIPGVRGLAAISPAFSVSAAHANTAQPDIVAYVKDAYGIAADGSDYAAKTAGSDPMVRPGTDYTDKRFRTWYSTGDPRIPPASHAVPFLAKIAPYAAEASSVPFAGSSHGDLENNDAADTLAFFARCL